MRRLSTTQQSAIATAMMVPCLACVALEHQTLCGSTAVLAATTCTDEHGNAGEFCILVQTQAVGVSRCVDAIPGQIGADQCGSECVFALRKEGECNVDGECLYGEWDESATGCTSAVLSSDQCP